MKQHCKIILLFIIFSFTVLDLSAIETTEKKMQVLITKYFDIIFTEESKLSASILAEQADNLYLKACELLDSEPYFRLPVALVSGVDVLNGYFSYAPYNHIVLYDTIPGEGSLAVFSESLCSVFYHEVVHAVSLQKKSKAWKVAGKIFGDIFTIAPFLYTPLFLVEGVTVSLESNDGEGRLNDAFASHIIRQAKIEGLFPNWQHVSGVRDIYPVGSLPYLFGGAFSAYLQDTYGMEKYAAFWEACGRYHFFGSLETIVKKTYEKKLVELWNEFQDSVIVPDSKLLDPRTTTEITVLQTKKSLYQFLTQSKKGYAWFDASSNELWYESFETGERKKLFTTSDGQQNISLSLDGDYLVSSYVQAYPFGQNTASVFHVQTQKKIQTFQGLRDACLVKLSDENKYLAGVHTKGQIASLELLLVWDTENTQANTQEDTQENTQKNKEEKVDFIRTFPIDSIPFSPTPLDDGRLAYILKEKNNWSIVLWNPLTDVEEKYLFQSGREPLKYLNPVFESGSVIGLSFSYGEKNTLPKMAFLDFASHTFFIQTQEISGGVYYPLIKDSAIIFTAQFFEYNSLFVSPIDSVFQDARIEEANTYLVLEKESETSNLSETGLHTNLDFLNPSFENYTIKKYNPLSFMTKGIFFPIIEFKVDNKIETENEFEKLSFSAGFRWITGDPFDKWLVHFIPTYDILKEKIQLETSIQNTELGFPLILNGKSVVGFDGYMFNNYLLSPTIQISLGNSPYFMRFTSTLQFLSVRKNAESPFENFINSGNSISFSSLRKVGLHHFGKKGFDVGFEFCFLDENSANVFESPFFMYSVFGSYSFAQLLPFENSSRFTYNLPTIFEASLFPSVNMFDKQKALWSASAKTTLFAFDLQNNISSLYIQRFALEADYKCAQKTDFIDYKNPIENFSDYNSMNFSDSFGIGAYFTSSQIIGMLLTQLKIDMGAEFRYHIREHSPEWSFLVRIN